MASVRLTALLSVLAVGAGAAGCGQAADKDSAKDFKGDQRAVAQTVEDLQDHATDYGKLCNDTLSQSFARAVIRHGKDSCSTSLKRSLRDSDTSSDDLQVKGVSIEGARATARVVSEVTGAKDRTETFTFVREGRPARWKISGVSG